MANRFNEDETAHSIPEEVFPLWFENVERYDVVKSHTRIVYRVWGDGRCCYVKINPESDQKGARPLDRARYDRSTDFVLHLADSGVPVARPIISLDGNAVEIQTFEGVDMIVQGSEEAVGETVYEDCRDAFVFERCGVALAHFHSAASTYSDASGFGTDEWEREWADTGDTLPETDPVVREEYDRIDAWLVSQGGMPGGKGLNHGDTNVLNFIDDGQTVSMIDVDSPIHTWYAIDLAGPVRDSKTMAPDERRNLWASFIQGYRTERETDIDYETIRWILRQWMLVTYLAYANMPNPEQKTYLKRWYSYVEDPGKW